MTTALATPVKPRNPVLVWLVWPLITLGIYFFVWYYKIHKEMADLRRDPEAPVVGPLLVMLFLSWTGIAAIISFWRTGTRIRQSQESAGLAPSCSPLVGFLLNFLFGLGILYYQLELNKIATRFA
ncbi:DUF4234 domain-containing protein [Nocardia sp. CDC160]|uniref:DUF4234 domain-containing protein n=1 Tax=Nocardia sp. CDC160 TaxID=3112166 RepID=UPI002DB55960|nr:DUF4234 domain-containing protein [Nocardia sp. CDC160]MEC3916030.1 DUF4234 domain-containing protein [Nocardia sp. CDC160]